MNLPIFLAGCFSLAALAAHSIIGTRESASLAPKGTSQELKTHWIQSMCAFQLVTIDLLAITIALFVIAVTDLIYFEKELSFIIAAIYAFWGMAWLIQLGFLKVTLKEYFKLPQWILFWVCSLLIFFGY